MRRPWKVTDILPPPATESRGNGERVHMSLSPIRTAARSLLGKAAVRVLEARFHPQRKTRSRFVVVGYLVWRTRRQTERPIFHSITAPGPHPIESKMHYLMRVTEPDCFQRLQSLRSDCWSFVSVSPDEFVTRGWSAF